MSVTPSLESVRMNSAITEHNENTSCELAETSPFYWSESKITRIIRKNKKLRESCDKSGRVAHVMMSSNAETV